MVVLQPFNNEKIIIAKMIDRNDFIVVSMV